MSAAMSLEALLSQLEKAVPSKVKVSLRRCASEGCPNPPAEIRQRGRLYYTGICAPCAERERLTVAGRRLDAALARIPARHRVFALEDAAIVEHVRPPAAVTLARRISKRPPIMILIRGKATGIGKTTLGTAFLLSAIRAARLSGASRESVDRAASVEWHSAIDLGLAARESKLGATPPAIAAAVRASVLLVDELGREDDVETLWRVLYDRHREERATVVTTALDPRELRARFDDGGFRRLFEPPHAEVIELGLVQHNGRGIRSWEPKTSRANSTVT